MILSKSARYALQATLCLAEGSRTTSVTVDEIAARLDVPRNYLSKILHLLARTEVLDSTRGPGGGFRLAVPPEELRLSDVVRHFDEMPDEAVCVLGRESCSNADPCRAHERWSEVRQAIVEFLHHTRLSELNGTQAGSLRPEAASK